jgi:hypothetical protein
MVEFIEFMRALAKATGVVSIIGLLTIIVGRALWIRWSRRWQFAMKYNIFKSKVDPIKAEWIIEALKRGLNYNKMKMKLLLAGFKDADIYEMLWLSERFSKNIKVNNWRVKENGTKKDLPTHIQS